MKKSELKSIIKECVKEILFEEGVLSNLVAEVAFGISKAQGQLVESSAAKKPESEFIKKNSEEASKERSKRLLETKKKMLNAIGSEKMRGVFEGTDPLPNTGNSNTHSPLAGRESGDAGVDISGLFGLAGQRWKELK
jgi:hypothetical protein